jgi:DNA-binding winged helix-turn-helix (wHTH) protein/alpha-beta hydrolase superfamily lysophospholipase
VGQCLREKLERSSRASPFFLSSVSRRRCGGAALKYIFEQYSLDPGRRELRRRTELVAIEPQVFDLLHFLIRHRDRVVSKNDLLTGVWNGRIVSESTLTSRINLARSALGDDGERQRLIRTVARNGYRFVGEVREELSADRGPGIPGPTTVGEPPAGSTQPVVFCKTKDGINLAAASIGNGPPLVRAAHWITNIEYDWREPTTGPLLQRLARSSRLIRYDGRGTGLSDRNVPHISFSTLLDDLESVVEKFHLDRINLLGISGGAAASIAFAVRHPRQVTKLVLYGGYALGRNKRGLPRHVDEAKAFLTMLQSGWGDERSIFWRAFNEFFIPTATPEEVKSFADFQLVSAYVDDALKMRKAVDDIDVLDLLPKVEAPTLIFHCLRDNLVPFEQGRVLAALIPNAKFVALDSANHALFAREPSWATMASEIESFLAEDDLPDVRSKEDLS